MAATGQSRFLIFNKTAGFYHESIPVGTEALMDMAAENGIGVDSTKDAGVFTDRGLSRYDAVLFLSTTGDVLNDEQQEALVRYIRGGGGYVGIHAASDTEHDWPWYGQLVGAYFANHPRIQEAHLNVVDPLHLATRDLPEEWIRTDEWYNHDYTKPDVNVLITIDKTSYVQRGGQPGEGEDPHAWYQEFEGGRSFYTAMGHTDESFSEPLFMQHVWGGLIWAMGLDAEPSGSR